MNKVMISIDHVDHDIPGWGHIVAVTTDSGIYSPIAICDTAERAEIVQLALRCLTDADPDFVIELTLNAIRAAAEQHTQDHDILNTENPTTKDHDYA